MPDFDFDTRKPQEPDEPNKLRTLLSATRSRVVLIANRVRILLIANRLRALLICGGILLLVVAVPLGARIYSSIEMGDPQQKLAGGGGLPQGAPNEDPTDKIAFVANGELAVIGADGTGLITLTHSPTTWESNYDWSPDGQKIIFYRDDRLHVINVDGTGENDLTRLPYEAEFDWSPDGRKIALAAEDLYVINADGTGRRKLTNTGASQAKRSPSFSPDGEKIVFVTNNDVYLISADGSGLKNLTDTPATYMQNGMERPTPNGTEYGASWSPSGEKIAFVRQRTVSKGQFAHTVYDLYVMNTDGTGETLIAKNVSYGPPDPHGGITFPAFSPDGKKIAFARQADFWDRSEESVSRDIYVADTDGTRERKLIDTPSADETLPAWSSDGQKIAFKRCCENAEEIAKASASARASARASGSDVVWIHGIYVMNADGTGDRKLTDTPIHETFRIQWRPVG